MSDTTSRALRQAWRLTTDDPNANEIPVSKLYELLTNLEWITKKKILDLDSISIIKSFINDNKHKNLTITLDSFKPFFDDLIGTPLQSIIGTPPPKLNLNLSTHPTTNFINKELINLKKQSFQDEEDIKYRDRLIDELESSNTRLNHNYNQTRRDKLKIANELNVSNKYIDQLHSYKLSKDSENQLLLKLNDQIHVQNQLVKELKGLKKNMIEPRSITLKSVPEISKLPIQSQRTTSKRSLKITWGRLISYTFTFLMILSLLNFSFEYFQDSLMDNIDSIFEDVEL